ncbi:MAG: peptide chain release factor N(5)-glutamine methyltransferase [Clostridia bacterium]|nr:peptide chain release factor N(5)-glutamine methyltransferase [Clostridia bacterium]
MEKRDLSFLCEHFSGEELEKAIERVENGEPLAYVIGEWYFYGLTFSLNKDTLIPRPDTEHAVDYAIKLLPQNARFVDFGTGSGCIALSILDNRPDCTALLCDISRGALDCAQKNAESIGIIDRTEYLCGDMTTPCLDKDELFDAIISNPPYIRSDVINGLSVQVKHEPHRALDGGEDGMDFYRAIFEIQTKNLKPDGLLILEIGYDQAEDIRTLSDAYGYSCEVFRDYGGNDRIAICRKQK